MRAGLVVLLVTLAGCSGAAADDPDGHFVNYRWGNSARSCTNNLCSYGDNADAWDIKLECRVQPDLSWDAVDWVHGTVTAEVLDDDGVLVATHTVSANGHGSEPVDGKPGTWTFRGLTNDANGKLEIRLSCI